MSMTSSLSGGDRYVVAYDSARFTDLRRHVRTFTAWASVVFTGWWLVAIVLGAFVPEFYRRKITDNVNVGTLFVLVTFALVLVIPSMYLRYARTRLDPLADEIRTDLEGAPR